MHGLERLGSYLGDVAAAAVSPSAQALLAGFLGWVFLWGGAAKLQRPWLAAMAIVDFGVMARSRIGAAVSLGLAEGLLGALLLVAMGSRAWLSALACIALFGFVGLIWRALRFGRSFACFCFGDAATTLSRATLARTGGLAAVAVFVCASSLLGDDSELAADDRILAPAAGLAMLGSLVIGARLRAVWKLPPPPGADLTRGDGVLA